MFDNSFSEIPELIYKGLNQAQIDAIFHTEGPLLVLAAAGTGKTTVLTNRIAYIIYKKLAFPQNILAVTFTNKASKEMQYRLSKFGIIKDFCSYTFHSIANKILRSYINNLELKIDNNFSIIGISEQISCIKKLMIDSNINIQLYHPKIINSIIAGWKDRDLSETDTKNLDSTVSQIAQNIYPKYQNILKNSNLLDFGDLLIYCLELFRNKPKILSYFQQKFQYILIDEYQDTNIVQYNIAKMIGTKNSNICCVGDDDQSIYTWRGAEPSYILKFGQDFPDARIIKLEQNYRSTKFILNAASNIIQNNKSRHDKALWTKKQYGEKIKIIGCTNEVDESFCIAKIISKTMGDKKYNAYQIAVLVRASFQTRALEETFVECKIPYKIVGGVKFYERAEIKDIISYIQLAINYNNDIAFERIINIPKRSIGNSTIKKIRDFSSINNLSMFCSIEEMFNKGYFKSKLQKYISEFIQLIQKIKNQYNDIEIKPIKVTNDLLIESGYLEYIKKSDDINSTSKIENIEEMLKVIDEFDNIYQFIEHISLFTDTDLTTDILGTVTVMTMHAAKGLEFDLVFLAGWEELIFPHKKALNTKYNQEKALEEERRLAYVAITRAKKNLYITYTQNRKIFGETIQLLPSRFIQEISDQDADFHSSDEYLYEVLNFKKPQYSDYYNDLRSRKKHKNHLQYGLTEPTPAILEEKNAGKKVKHPKFGNGIIVKRSGQNLDIVFEKIGFKTIKESFVTLI
ncbi:ATP-dependent DNA helicase PcrA [Rickettsia endosymbiont of Cardiosporidium cionae]|nr:UvrD-helicase domain-containing protein [Rickettsia endosymbiont of Cardiosporidium cionae]KAF8818927.1 ATP-dependent DNA helicase PcrA [Rickettsia endosymbiont of Cardiosporidium cionae]